MGFRKVLHFTRDESGRNPEVSWRQPFPITAAHGRQIKWARLFASPTRF